MNTVDTIQNQIIEEFELLGGDREMVNYYIMELGDKLPELDDRFKTEENLVKGCQSKVWLTTKMKDGQVFYYADSNAHITKGLISMLVRVLSGQRPDFIINSDLYFIDKIGLNRFIGTQRSNGFAAMIKQMKLYALAYKNKEEVDVK